VHQVAEDKVLAVWASKYCQSGFPLYSLTSTEEARVDYETYLADLETTYGKNALYLYDLFGVAGNQGTVDYTAQGYPDIGEIPYSCIWTARGKLIPGDDPKTIAATDGTLAGSEATHIVWTAPERLTSGVRDANLPAVDCAKGAGCVLTWQEDPEGLRPGKGLGPGEGWSGAIANAKTDIWYSYISFEDFDLVVNDTDLDGKPDPEEALSIEEYEDLKLIEMDRPKPYVPMAMPVRITDNEMCKATGGLNGGNPEDPYCWLNFDNLGDITSANVFDYLEDLREPQEGAKYCADEGTFKNNQDKDITVCITEDGRWLNGRVASTRVRMVLKPYFPDGEATDLDGDSWPDDGSAWISFAAEETKALGVTGDTDGDGVADVDPVDIGKDMFYYSFDFAQPYNLSINTTIDLVPYVIQQGGMLNQPAKCSPYFITTTDTNPDATCPEPYAFFDIQEDPITGYEYYLTEIARRFALTLNNIPNITDTTINTSGLAGMLIYKQGIIWQGGPADIMLRRLIKPAIFNAATDNPFAYQNMECVNTDGTSGWVFPTIETTGVDENNNPITTTSSNPNYLEGLCMANAINITGTTIKTCTDGGTDNNSCADSFPVADDGSIPDTEEFEKFPKVLEWRQCGLESDGSLADTTNICIDSNDLTGDQDDQSWENPFDVAKGHRGFLYGDYVMMMYAWSPNWQSNAVGNDHYNLYARRSFDGGKSWTTTPSTTCGPVDELCGSGVKALEYYYEEPAQGDNQGVFIPYLWEYDPGEYEQARNLSLLHGNKVTILDPRYSPPGGLKQYSTISPKWMTASLIAEDLDFTSDDVLPYPDDLAIDPSKFYIVYETGDNTTVDVGEAIPLNLYYSRATVFGDTYEWYDYVNDEFDGLFDDEGNLLDMTSDIEPRFPWLENDQEILSGEASVVMNPGGTFAYNVWNQWQEEITHWVDEYGIEHEEELIFNSDIIFRRLLWVDDDTLDSVNLQPVASILATTQEVFGIEEDQTISLFASARDLDKIGDESLDPIQEYVWTINGVAVPEEFQDEFKDMGFDCFKDKQCNAPARVVSGHWDGSQFQQPGWSGQNNYNLGWYEFALQVKDNDDPAKWSKIVKVKKYIANSATDLPGFRIFLPLTTK
jgi:hypothetical protein